MKKSEKEVIAGGKVRTRKRELAELHNGRDVTMGTLETMGTLGTKEVNEHADHLAAWRLQEASNLPEE